MIPLIMLIVSMRLLYNTYDTYAIILATLTYNTNSTTLARARAPPRPAPTRRWSPRRRSPAPDPTRA